MNWPYEWHIGWRYLRAGRGGRSNPFVSFISAISMLGIALGVAALIVVLSVMNGFQHEVRERMLSVVPHVQVFERQGAAITDVAAVLQTARADGQVQAAAASVLASAMLARGDAMRFAAVRGIDPAQEAGVLGLVRDLLPMLRKELQPGAMRVVLGKELAAALNLRVGDPVALVQPATDGSGAPRTTGLTVGGVLDTGHFEFDNTLALMNVTDAETVFGLRGPNTVQIHLADAQRAPEVARRLNMALGADASVQDWTWTNRNWFDSVQIQKRMMALILTLIVAVAAFNLVSTLVMTVTDKRADIAILRTLGASPRSVMGIFLVQGSLSGVVGTLSGVALGLLIAFNVGSIVPAIESALHMKFLDSSIYLISRVPSDPQWGDVMPIGLVSLLLSFAATLYPSWRASRLPPAEALRGE